MITINNCKLSIFDLKLKKIPSVLEYIFIFGCGRLAAGFRADQGEEGAAHLSSDQSTTNLKLTIPKKEKNNKII